MKKILLLAGLLAVPLAGCASDGYYPNDPYYAQPGYSAPIYYGDSYYYQQGYPRYRYDRNRYDRWHNGRPGKPWPGKPRPPVVGGGGAGGGGTFIPPRIRNGNQPGDNAATTPNRSGQFYGRGQRNCVPGARGGC